MCAPTISTGFLIREKFRERFRAAATCQCLELHYRETSLPNLAGFFCAVCKLTNVQQTHMLIVVRNACATWKKEGAGWQVSMMK